MSQTLIETLPRTRVSIDRAANNAILGYLDFRARLWTPANADPKRAQRQQQVSALLGYLAATLPAAAELRVCDQAVLAAPNGVIFAVAGSNGLLKFRLPRPFPEVELSVGLLPAGHVGHDWCYCDPRGEPEANLEEWTRLAYEFALEM